MRSVTAPIIFVLGVMIDGFTTIWLDGSSFEIKDFVMSGTSGHCVVGWYNEEGRTDLKPVVCSTVIEVLSDIIAKLVVGRELEKEEKDIAMEMVIKLLAEEEDETPAP